MLNFTKQNYLLLAVPLVLGVLSGCNKTEPVQAQSPDSNTVVADSDPNAGNLAPVASNDTAPSAPAEYSNATYDLPADTQYPSEYAYDTSNQQPIEATQPPPPLPEYSQPACPGDGYYWTPGYWAYSSGSGYYWVPGAWVLAPWVDALWTPPYWDFDNGYYRWHAGYWGPHIGFYGGIDYGFGYTGHGYYGAYWNRGQLVYNREVTNVLPGVIGNVRGYSAPRGNGSRVSYNGGRGGIDVRPTAQEMAVVHDPRTPPVAAQVQHARQAGANRAQFASAGHAPEALAAPTPLAAAYKAPAPRPPAAAMRMAARPAQEVRQPPQQQPQQRPAPAPVETRPVPQQRQAPQPVQAQRPEMHPLPAPQQPQRPAPEVRQAPAPAQRPAPVQRPAPEVRQPQQQQRPAPIAHPAAPAPQPRPAPEVRQAPAPPQRPAPEVRQAPPPRPAPVARPAEPPSRPAPPAKPEEDKKKG